MGVTHHRHQCKKCFAYQNRARTYGLTISEVKEMIDRENCDICETHIKQEKDRYIDHDHETGEVRGMLCNRCNTCLQVVENGIYKKMLKYLNDK